MTTPSEAIARHQPAGEIDVPESGGTVSWADLERDSSGWLGNAMQWAYYTSIRHLEPLIKEADDPELLRLWRYFQTSDHLYYMFTAGGAPGEVHSYFSPYQTPMDAFVAAESLILDFENRVRTAIITANEPFLFCTGVGDEHFTGVMTWSLKAFAKALTKASPTVLEFHNNRGDFESWAQQSLKDAVLAAQLKQIRIHQLQGKQLRKALSTIAKKRFRTLTEQAQTATQLY